jgi:hypothetical protein
VAAQQLRDSDTPLGRIAEQVGYESEAAFNRAFKRSFGVGHLGSLVAATTGGGAGGEAGQAGLEP